MDSATHIQVPMLPQAPSHPGCHSWMELRVLDSTVAGRLSCPAHKSRPRRREVVRRTAPGGFQKRTEKSWEVCGGMFDSRPMVSPALRARLISRRVEAGCLGCQPCKKLCTALPPFLSPSPPLHSCPLRSTTPRSLVPRSLSQLLWGATRIRNHILVDVNLSGICIPLWSSSQRVTEARWENLSPSEWGGGGVQWVCRQFLSAQSNQDEKQGRSQGLCNCPPPTSGREVRAIQRQAWEGPVCEFWASGILKKPCPFLLSFFGRVLHHLWS